MTRREEREHLLRLLFLREFYEADEIEEQIQLYFDVILPNEGTACPEKDTVIERVNSIASNLPEIDQVLAKKMQNWNMSRIGLVEKNLLRLAAYEMLIENLSEKVAINEAVELAKQYGGEHSPGFINGVLAKIVKGTDSQDGK